MVESTDAYFLANGAKEDCAVPPGGLRSLTADECLALFDTQLASKHLDLAARRLREQGKGYYTIGSPGHEGNAALATALLPTDPASHGRFSSSASCGVFRVSWWWVRHHGCLCRPESGENAARVWSAYDSLLWMLTPCQNAMWSRMCAACGLGCG
jgi:hypothetical protein